VALAPPSRVPVWEFPPEVPTAVADAYRWGAAAADAATDAGTDLLLVSVADAAAAATLSAHLLGFDPVDAMGWPARAGVDDATWVAEVAALRDGLRGVRAVFEPTSLLEALGSPAIAAGVGLLLQAGVRRTPVMLDGAGAVACAQLAYRVTRRVRGWWQVAQSDGSVLAEAALEKLPLDPLLRLGIHAEDGTAARLALAVLEAATASAEA
jgi:nicotinate-nucleotide--dimethylbenzimidazole phosphoribosyltransferase